MRILTLRYWSTVMLLLSGSLLVVAVIALLSGSEPIGLLELFRLLGNPGRDPVGAAILWRVRFPRVLLAGVVGGSLGVSGAVLQTLLRNPLADPFIMGISSGAAVGAYLAMTVGVPLSLWGLTAIPGCAFVGGLLAVGLVFLVARVRGGLPGSTLLLSGVMVNAILTSLVLFLTVTMEGNRVTTVWQWLLGHLSSLSWPALTLLSGYLLLCGTILIRSSPALNLLVLGEETAESMGVPVARLRRRLLFLTTLLVAAVVSVSGLIGFVGVVAPHLVRLLLGSDHRLVLPASILAGGLLLIGADLVARVLVSPMVLPVGVMTALIGGPLFLWLLHRQGENQP